MKNEQDVIKDLAEIRSMMERSSKFLSLSGWAGIMAGLYALAGAYVAHYQLGFQPDSIGYLFSKFSELTIVAILVLILALSTAIFFSFRNARQKGESIWNATSRRMLGSMAIPLLTGAVGILIFIANGQLGLIAPFTLLFYGLSLVSAGHFTVAEVRWLGIAQILLGLLNLGYLEAGLLFWTLGFGGIHIVYGVYMHFRYER